MTRSQTVERLCYLLCARGYLADGVAEIQAQRREHLVVARAAQMDAATGFTSARYQLRFESGLAIFLFQLHAPFASRVGGSGGVQRRGERVEIGGGQEADRV